ncbi:MAG: hypothetical protein GY854_33575 [Deltaproteobacteria bacterium]|nr:hypothetical protein [Deltaproteobacteria bacterium]
MGTAKDKLLQDTTRPSVVQDCVQLVDNEVASKKGVTGMMVKAGYKAFRAVKPSIVKEAVEILLDEFVKVLDGHYTEYEESHPDRSTSFETWATARDKRIADNMLGVTDAIMDRSNKTALKKIYQGMRKIAEKNVAQAVPAVARLVAKHVD